MLKEIIMSTCKRSLNLSGIPDTKFASNWVFNFMDLNFPRHTRSAVILSRHTINYRVTINIILTLATKRMDVHVDLTIRRQGRKTWSENIISKIHATFHISQPIHAIQCAVRSYPNREHPVMLLTTTAVRHTAQYYDVIAAETTLRSSATTGLTDRVNLRRLTAEAERHVTE